EIAFEPARIGVAYGEAGCDGVYAAFPIAVAACTEAAFHLGVGEIERRNAERDADEGGRHGADEGSVKLSLRHGETEGGCVLRCVEFGVSFELGEAGQ